MTIRFKSPILHGITELKQTVTYLIDKVKISAFCKVTNKLHSVTVPLDAYKRWSSGDYLIQDAMPEVSVEDREFLISGISPEGWKKTFSGDEE